MASSSFKVSSHVESLGEWVIEKLNVFLGLSTLLYLTLKELAAGRKKGFPLVFEITLRQIYFTGVQGLRVVLLVSLALGTVTIIQAGSKLAFLGGAEILVPILVVVIFRELGPLLTAIIVIGRSGTAIATELGNMIVAHELEGIQAMGINPVYFIVAPRIIGVTLAAIGLNIFFNAVALLGGFVLSQLILPITLPEFLLELEKVLTVKDLVFGFLKSALFGLLIALTCTHYGLSVRYSSIEVPQMATRGVVSAILFCFVTDALLTVLFYL